MFGSQKEVKLKKGDNIHCNVTEKPFDAKRLAINSEHFPWTIRLKSLNSLLIAEISSSIFSRALTSRQKCGSPYFPNLVQKLINSSILSSSSVLKSPNLVWIGCYKEYSARFCQLAITFVHVRRSVWTHDEIKCSEISQEGYLWISLEHSL